METLEKPSSAQPVEISGYRDYIPELDGLRALAILSVVLFHLHCPGFSMGWAGVELFFVLSGFLITRILLGSAGRPYYFRNFYVRRSLRIFPIYYLTIAVYFLALAVIPKSAAIHATLAGTASRPWTLLPYYLTYLQTIPQLRSGYQALPLLSITWTLAIEEQFYWIWPFVIAIVRRAWLLPVLAILWLAAPLTRALVLAKTRDPHYVSGLLPDQLDSLAMGAAIAAFIVVARIDPARLRAWGARATTVGTIGVLLLALRSGFAAYWSAAGWATQPHNVLMYSAMAVLFGGVVMLCVGDSPVMRWLRAPALLQIGKISYGIYLYHGFVIFAVFGVAIKLRLMAVDSPPGPLHFLLSVLCLVGSYLVALLSWKFIEGPINGLKGRFTKRAVPMPGDAPRAQEAH